MMRDRIRIAVRRSAIVAGSLIGVPVVASLAYAQSEYMATPKDQIAQSHTAYSIWVQSLTNFAMRHFGAKSAASLREDCQQASKVNEQLLLGLLERCKDTKYGKEFDFAKIASREEFRKAHPITTHDHYEDYFSRIYEGEDSVSFPGQPRMIAETSGTSGSRKLIPVNNFQRQVFFKQGIMVVFDAMVRGVASNSEGKIKWPNLQKSCKLMFNPKYSYNPDGLKVGPNSSSPGDNKTLLELYSTPVDAWEVKGETELLFLHCLYALIDRNLGIIESNFASGAFNFFVCLDQNWVELVSTIRNGKLPEHLNIDPVIRTKLESKLFPNPDRADEIFAVFSQKTTAGGKEIQSSRARKIWPTLHTIMANETGSFHVYGQKIRSEWIGNDIPIFSPLYAATEGLIGVNTELAGPIFTVNPNTMFDEFLSIEDSILLDDNKITAEEASSRTLFLEQLTVGESYEMLISNLTGLYRYRFGDVVRCVGYEGEAPLVEISYRKGQFLNAAGERTSEEAFYKALFRTVSKDWGLCLEDYTTVEHFLTSNDRRPKYTVYLELTKKNGHNKEAIHRLLTRKEIDALDASLGEVNSIYALFRAKGRLQLIEAVPVQAGTFEKVRRAMVDDLHTSPTQTKQPRVTRNAQLVKILEENAITK